MEDIEAEKGLMFLQQDGASPHYSNQEHAALETCFPGKWISRADLISSPPQSSDFTPLDFFRGYKKNVVYGEKI